MSDTISVRKRNITFAAVLGLISMAIGAFFLLSYGWTMGGVILGFGLGATLLALDIWQNSSKPLKDE